MSAFDRKALIDKNDKDFSVRLQCSMLEIHRSGLYYTPTQASTEDLAFMRRIDELHLEDPTLGTRRLSKILTREGKPIGRTRVGRLMRIMRITAIYRAPRTTIADPLKYKYPYLLRNLRIVRSNQVWMIDISYIPMPKGFMYLFAIIDVHSRHIVGWSISNSMEAEWVCKCIKEAIHIYGKPEIINSDQGSQFTSDVYIKLIKSYQTIKISMDGKGRAIDNVYIERFFRTIKYDKLYIEPSKDGLTLYKRCKEFIEYYNKRRLHSSLDYKTPLEVYKNAA